MKARFFIFVILLFCNICIHAQLKVDSTGVVSVGPDSLGNARLNIGNVIFNENADYTIETSGEFVLDKGTEIELGATLVVTPSDINY